MVSFLLKRMSEITKYENGMIILKEKQQYIVRAVLGYKADELKDKTLFKDKQDIYFRKMIEENKVAMLADIKMSQYGIDKSFKSLIGFPIIYYGENVGIIILYSDTIQTLSQIQNEILFDFAGQVGIVIENARLFNQVEKMAAIDGLTGAFNRPHFLKLSEALIKDHRNKGTTLSLIMIDIDYFKKINDTYGHLVGDRVLWQLVAELKIELGEESIIGRYGGEEFLILLKETNLETALTIAERLRLKIESLRVDIDKDNLIGFTISIGVSVTNDDISDNFKLIEKADQALYISKLNGRNQVNTVINLP